MRTNRPLFSVVAAMVAFAFLCSEAAAIDSASIKYMGTDDRLNEAKLEQTDIHGVVVNLKTDDPIWAVEDIGNGKKGSYEWIAYYAQDHSRWEAKTHCEYSKDPSFSLILGIRNAATTLSMKVPQKRPFIHCWFEHRRAENHNDWHNDFLIQYIGAGNQVCRAELKPVVPPFPATPHFEVNKPACM